MRILTGAVLLLVFAAVTLADGKDRQVIEGDVLKDLDYGFELKRPSSDWTFMKEKSIAKVNPDAAAGLYNSASKAFVLVVAEEAPDTSLEDYADLLIETMDVEAQEVVVKKALTINGLSAYQYKVNCKSEGVKLVYYSTIYKKDDFYFQVVCFWTSNAGGSEPKGIETVFSSFTTTPGVKPRVRVPQRPEKMHGVGWRVEKDIYQNGVYGFAVKLPSNGWRFMSREELKDSNPEASLGAEHEQSGAYVVVIAENLGGMKAQEYEKLVLDSFKAENPAKEHKESDVKLGGKDVVEHVFREVALGKVLADFFLVTMVRGQVGYQVMSWCLHGKSPAAAKELGNFYAGFSWLEAAEREKLRADLLKLADCERSVAANECFRNRTYVNFEHGFSLSLPQGFWNHLIGTTAWAENEDASLLFTNLDHELNGTVLLEEMQDAGPSEFHDVMLDMLDTVSISGKREAEAILELIETDTDLDNIRKEDRFKEIAKAAKGEKDLPKEEPEKQPKETKPAAKMTDAEYEEAHEKAYEHVEEGEMDKALELYGKIIQARPDDLEANYWSACLYSLKKDKDKALAHLERTVRTGRATIKEAEARIQTRTIKSGGLDILSTRFSEKEGDSEATYHLATVTVGKMHATVLFSGLKGNLDNTEKLELEILKSIKLAAKPAEKAVRLADGTYMDHRLGFKLTPPEAGFKVVDMTWKKPEITEFGTFVMMTGKKSVLPPALIAGALHTDISDITGFVTEILGNSPVVGKSNLKISSEEAVTWLGSPARLLKLEGNERGKRRQLEFYAATIGGTFYFVLYYCDTEGAELEKLRKSLELLP